MATSNDNAAHSWDAVVVGGGPAGLQAALTLARVHRRVLLLDSGRYRNDPAQHLHNVVTHDGTPPAEFRATARRELSAYPTATVEEATVSAVAVDGDGFRVELAEPGRPAVTARGLVLATGVRDRLPDKPGLAELWGTVVAHCPFCHGHELAGRHVAVLGAEAGGHLGRLMGPVAERITVLTDGADVPADLPAGLAVRTEPVTGFRRTSDGEEGAVVSFASGPDEQVGGVFVRTTVEQSAPFAAQLGLALLPSGCVEVDAFGRTSLPGVHAAGDLAHTAALPMPAASVVSAVAAGQAAAASLIAFRL
jgi:thioredoxin reductase